MLPAKLTGGSHIWNHLPRLGGHSPRFGGLEVGGLRQIIVFDSLLFCGFCVSWDSLDKPNVLTCSEMPRYTVMTLIYFTSLCAAMEHFEEM